MSRGKKASSLQLDATQTQDAVLAIKRFMADRFELELGSFEAEEVLDFFAREFAPHFYNKAISDVQAHLKDRFDSIESDLWALEKA
ncbi:DUF2164 domain-containing protein [Metapseudomonas otitidis]|uniref:DUF2164 domain-containing protein n=1 Tax=Metapseudomonas otitidis TaxID=319939 RepID=UPI003CF36BDF